MIDTPSPEHQRRLVLGTHANAFRDFACSYRCHGAEWAFTIRAVSFEDAEYRLRYIGISGQVLGDNVMEVPAVPGAGLFVRALCALRNWWER